MAKSRAHSPIVGKTQTFHSPRTIRIKQIDINSERKLPLCPTEVRSIQDLFRRSQTKSNQTSKSRSPIRIKRQICFKCSNKKSFLKLCQAVKTERMNRWICKNSMLRIQMQEAKKWYKVSQTIKSIIITWVIESLITIITRCWVIKWWWKTRPRVASDTTQTHIM